MPYLSMVFTARFVAQKLGVEQALIETSAKDIRPKDGCLSVINRADGDDPSVYAFTADGIDYVQQMLVEQKRL